MKLPELSEMGANTFLIQVDRPDSQTGIFSGRILNTPAGDLSFSSISRMVLLIDSILDSGVTFPVRKGDDRSADLELEILFRQNSSWQGKARFPGQNKEAVFRSVLELIVLLETVLNV